MTFNITESSNTDGWVVPIVEIENVKAHPNADKLELCTILGYQSVIPKGIYKSGNIAVFFPPDTEIPTQWVDILKIGDFLRGKNKNRVGQIKLRGEPSFGLIISLPEELKNCKVGDNVAAVFGAKKYEPPFVFPSPASQNNKQSRKDAELDRYIKKYTKIQNGRINTNVFTEDDHVVISEKLHGSNVKIVHVKSLNRNFAASMGRGDFSGRRECPKEEDNSNFIKRIWNAWFRKRNARRLFVRDITDYSRKEIVTNTYWHPWSIESVRNVMDYFVKNSKANVITIYGEIYGGSVQSLHYGIPNGQGYGFRIFDVALDEVYADWNLVETICKRYDAPIVPILYRGKFDINVVNQLAEGNTTLEGGHIREGCVIRTTTEQIHPRIGRKILKYIGSEYMLSKHKDLDTTDV